MIYQLYQAQADLLAPFRRFAEVGARLLWQVDLGAITPPSLRHLRAACSVVSGTRITHRRPPFGFDHVAVGGKRLAVIEEAADATAFGTLLHFRKDPEVVQPRVLLVAPMSGHFATLLRGTAKELLPEHDLYITDWHNARDIPLADGRFGMDEFIDHVIRFLETIGPGAHIIAVCQPAAAVLAAVAAMAEAGHPATPRSMTLMAGPIDTRINPTKVNDLATGQPIEWFERKMIGAVPWRYRGAGRHVYPGFMQLGAFVAMNLDRHMGAHFGHFRDALSGDAEAAAAHRTFYDEYNAVMDLPAEFFLETVQRVFQTQELARGTFTWRGTPIRPAAIRRTALLTVEGEKDDICAIGQTAAALDLCSGIPPARKAHHLQTGAGHYGVFSGRRWAREIYPRVRAMIQSA